MIDGDRSKDDSVDLLPRKNRYKRMQVEALH